MANTAKFNSAPITQILFLWVVAIAAGFNSLAVCCLDCRLTPAINIAANTVNEMTGTYCLGNLMLIQLTSSKSCTTEKTAYEQTDHPKRNGVNPPVKKP